MADAWTAQEPAREEWTEHSGKHFAVDVLDPYGHLVAVIYGDTAAIAEARAKRVERRSTR